MKMNKNIIYGCLLIAALCALSRKIKAEEATVVAEAAPQAEPAATPAPSEAPVEAATPAPETATAANNEAAQVVSPEEVAKRRSELDTAREQQKTAFQGIEEQAAQNKEHAGQYLKDLLVYLGKLVTEFIMPSQTNIKIHLANAQNDEAKNVFNKIKDAQKTFNEAAEELDRLKAKYDIPQEIIDKAKEEVSKLAEEITRIMNEIAAMFAEKGVALDDAPVVPTPETPAPTEPVPAAAETPVNADVPLI